MIFNPFPGLINPPIPINPGGILTQGGGYIFLCAVVRAPETLAVYDWPVPRHQQIASSRQTMDHHLGMRGRILGPAICNGHSIVIYSIL